MSGEKPVFPQDVYQTGSYPQLVMRQGGLTLLEFFTGCALMGVMAGNTARNIPLEIIAADAVNVAKAAVAELEKA